MTDAEGLHEIANTTKQDRKADIVFVHGLGGGSHSTWRHGKEGKTGHFFWPEELGRELPECGVWSLGYAAGITHWFGAHGMAIQDRARNLVLKLLNRNLGERPLIFITHSMGGLEVKEIIVRSQTRGSAEWKQLVASVHGIVFCGTPHRGAHLATAAKVLANYLRTQEHLQQMVMGAPILDTLHDEFIAWQRDSAVKVESYVEKVGLFRTKLWFLTLPLGLVVPSESGNPGIADCECHPITADHLTLVKPDSRDHDVYAGVLRFIHKVLDSAPTSIPPDPNIQLKHIVTPSDTDFDRAMSLYEKRIPDGIPRGDIARWVRDYPNENVLLVAKTGSDVIGTVLFHPYNDPPRVFLAYLVVRRHSPLLVSDLLMDRVLQLLTQSMDVETVTMLFEVARPIQTKKKDDNRRQLTLEPISRIAVFYELAVRKKWLLRAFDFDYVEPNFFCDPKNERPMYLMYLQNAPATSGAVPKNEVSSILKFIYTKLYPADYSDHEEDQRRFERYCQELFERKLRTLSDEVGILTYNTIREKGLKYLNIGSRTRSHH